MNSIAAPNFSLSSTSCVDLFPAIKQQTSITTNKNHASYLSIFYKIKDPYSGSLTYEEIESFLDYLIEGSFENKASPQEYEEVVHVMINLARQGTTDPHAKKILEQEIKELLEESPPPQQAYNGISAIASKGYSTIQTNYKASSSHIKKSIENNSICSYSDIQPYLYQAQLCYKKQGFFNKVGHFIKRNKKTIVITTCAVAATALAVFLGFAVANTIRQNKVDNTSPNSEPLENKENEAKHEPTANPPTNEPNTLNQNSNLIEPSEYSKNLKEATNDLTFIQGLKKVGSKITHDLYHGWAELEGSKIQEAEKVRNLMAKILPEKTLDSLNANTYEKQQLAVAKVHHEIDQFFQTQFSSEYLPKNKNKNQTALGILPSPWDILGSLKIPPTLVNNIKGWKLGSPINNLTTKGSIPRWSTVRQRHWKNKAFLHENGHVNNPQVYEATPKNIARMKKGLAPQFFNADKNCFESIELHHIPAQRLGGLFNFVELTPADHALKDAYRNIGK